VLQRVAGCFSAFSASCSPLSSPVALYCSVLQYVCCVLQCCSVCCSVPEVKEPSGRDTSWCIAVSCSVCCIVCYSVQCVAARVAACVAACVALK